MEESTSGLEGHLQNLEMKFNRQRKLVIGFCFLVAISFSIAATSVVDDPSLSRCSGKWCIGHIEF